MQKTKVFARLTTSSDRGRCLKALSHKNLWGGVEYNPRNSAQIRMLVSSSLKTSTNV